MADIQKISEEIKKHEKVSADAQAQILQLKSELQKAVDQAQKILGNDEAAPKKRGRSKTRPSKASKKAGRKIRKVVQLPEATSGEVLKAFKAGPKGGSSKTDVKKALGKDPGTVHISALLDAGKIKPAGGQGAGKKYKAI